MSGFLIIFTYLILTKKNIIMKNIHILPTDKPSRLVYNSTTKKLNLYSGNVHSSQCKNIYITSDEEIKEGDWFYNPRGKWIIKCNSNHLITVNLIEHKKIILTTDADLIKDGVQAIPDEFLEWFVKNPSCEEVNIKRLLNCTGECGICDNSCGWEYEITIPKEEPKQYNSEELEGFEDFKKMIKPKQETLEEAAENYSKITLNKSGLMSDKQVNGFIAGAKWQMERSYSEEEVLELLQDFANDLSDNVINIKFWFNKFKKK